MNPNLLLVAFFILTKDAIGTRVTSNRIYQTIDSNYYCLRRLNSTHTIGCQSDASGNVGVLHIIKNGTTDLDWVLKRGLAPPYIVGLYVQDFTTNNLKQMNESNRVNGVILLRQHKDVSSFSPDTKCPNENFGLYINNHTYGHCAKGDWNDDVQNQISGAMFMSWRFPIFLMKSNESNQGLEDCFDKHNQVVNDAQPKWPLCAVELRSRMNASVNAPTCLRRNEEGLNIIERIQFCTEIMSYNMLTTLYPTSAFNTPSNKSLIVIATRLDSMSLFNGLALGAKSVINTVITLLSIASTLTSLGSETRNTSNVLFAFFDGESWGYVGSSKLAKEMKSGSVAFYSILSHKNYVEPKLNLSQIKYFIELDQIIADSSSRLWVHTDPISNQNPTVLNETQFIVQTIKNASSGLLSVNLADKSNGLPPASFQSFLADNIDIPGVLVSSYDTKFVNKYYHSFLDDLNVLSEATDVNYITNVSTVISRAVAEQLGLTNSSAVQSDKTKILEIYRCFFGNTSYKSAKYKCPLLQDQEISYENNELDTQTVYLPSFALDDETERRNPYYLRVYRLLLNLTGTLFEVNKKDCLSFGDQDTNYIFNWDDQLEVCTRASIMITKAMSPAFNEETLLDSRSKYSTWTVSFGQDPSARIFLMHSFQQELSVLLTGLLVGGISLVFVYYFDKHSETLLTYQLALSQ